MLLSVLDLLAEEVSLLAQGLDVLVVLQAYLSVVLQLASQLLCLLQNIELSVL